MMIDLERIRDALDEAIERGEMTEQEAREEWMCWWEEFFREANKNE